MQVFHSVFVITKNCPPHLSLLCCYIHRRVDRLSKETSEDSLGWNMYRSPEPSLGTRNLTCFFSLFRRLSQRTGGERIDFSLSLLFNRLEKQKKVNWKPVSSQRRTELGKFVRKDRSSTAYGDRLEKRKNFVFWSANFHNMYSWQQIWLDCRYPLVSCFWINCCHCRRCGWLESSSTFPVLRKRVSTISSPDISPTLDRRRAESETSETNRDR